MLDQRFPATSLTIKSLITSGFQVYRSVSYQMAANAPMRRRWSIIHLKQHEYYTEHFIFIFDEQFVQVYDYCAAF